MPVFLITVEALKIAFVGDMPLQKVPVHDQSAPPPPQLEHDEHDEQLEQDDPPEEEDCDALYSSHALREPLSMG